MSSRQVQKSSGHQTVAEVILAELSFWGVRRIYGVIGDAIFGLLNAIGNQEQIQFIAVKHESVAAMMASAEAKLTGDIGVCAAQMGPGIGNLLNGLADAYFDMAPVLAITGQAPLGKIGTNYKQYMNQQELIKPIARFSSLITHADSVPELLTKALEIATREGTITHLSIPSDLFDQTTMEVPYKEPIFFSSAPVFKDLHLVTDLMRTAQRPMIVIGRSAREVSMEIEQLAEAWGAGIITSPSGKGAVPDGHRNMMGGIGEGGNPLLPAVFAKTDVVLLIGTTWWPEGYVPKDARIIQIDDKQANGCKGLPVEFVIIGNIKAAIQTLLGKAGSQKNEDWLRQIYEMRESWEIQNRNEKKRRNLEYLGIPGSTKNQRSPKDLKNLEKLENPNGLGISEAIPIHPARVIQAIENSVDQNAILTLDYGDSTLWFYRNFQATRQTVLLSEGWRTMGFGLPAAIAAKLCEPNREVVAITGDGGLEMVLADLLTATRYQTKITVILFNNGTLQMERDKMMKAGYRQVGSDLTNPDFSLLVKACGWDAYKVELDAELEEQLRFAIASSKPALVDIHVDTIAHPDLAP